MKNMDTIRPFTCAECGGTVDMRPGAGRTREYSRGFDVPIPDDFLIPTCGSCGELYVLPEIEPHLNAVLRPRFLRMQAEHFRSLIAILMSRHGVKQKDIVRACGVTPSYMSHVLGAKRQASTTLTRLLEAFVVSRSEFLRHVEGRRWSAFDAGLYVVKSPHQQTHPNGAARWRDDDRSATPRSQWAVKEMHVDPVGSEQAA